MFEHIPENKYTFKDLFFRMCQASCFAQQMNVTLFKYQITIVRVFYMDLAQSVSWHLQRRCLSPSEYRQNRRLTPLDVILKSIV